MPIVIGNRLDKIDNNAKNINLIINSIIPNTSNELANKINNTSNELITYIDNTSNELATYISSNSNKINQLDNRTNNLEYNYKIATSDNSGGAGTSHSNAYIYGDHQIEFKTNNNNIKTKIDNQGELNVYHDYDISDPTELAGWWNVEDKLVSLIGKNTQQDGAISSAVADIGFLNSIVIGFPPNPIPVPIPFGLIGVTEGLTLGLAVVNGRVDWVTENKQEKLIAGNNISITSNVISATGVVSIDYSAITNKPDKFPPESHNHPINEIIDLSKILNSCNNQFINTSNWINNNNTNVLNYISPLYNNFINTSNWINNNNTNVLNYISPLYTNFTNTSNWINNNNTNVSNYISPLYNNFTNTSNWINNNNTNVSNYISPLYNNFTNTSNWINNNNTNVSNYISPLYNNFTNTSNWINNNNTNVSNYISPLYNNFTNTSNWINNNNTNVSNYISPLYNNFTNTSNWINNNNTNVSNYISPLYNNFTNTSNWINLKQNKLIAGSNILIVDNVISATNILNDNNLQNFLYYDKEYSIELALWYKFDTDPLDVSILQDYGLHNLDMTIYEEILKYPRSAQTTNNNSFGSSTYGTGYTYCKAFDYDTTTFWGCAIPSGVFKYNTTGLYTSTSYLGNNTGIVLGEWVGIDCLQTIYLDNIKILPRTNNLLRSPRDLRIFASNDPTCKTVPLVWTQIYQYYDPSTTSTFQNATFKNFSIKCKTSYRYFAFLGAQVWKDSLDLAEIELYGKRTLNKTIGKPNYPITNAYLWNSTNTYIEDKAYLENTSSSGIQNLLNSITNGFTISFLYKTLNIVETYSLFNIKTPDGRVIFIEQNTEKIYFYVGDGLGDVESINYKSLQSGLLLEDIWYNIICSMEYTNSLLKLTIKIYTDTTNTISYSEYLFNPNFGALSNLSMSIGKYYPNDNLYKLYINDFRLYNKYCSDNLQNKLINGFFGQENINFKNYYEFVEYTNSNIKNIPILLNTKQNVLSAGSNILINNNIISATGFSTFSGNYNDLINKPVALTAGSNILINNNVISATGFSTFSGSYNNLTNKLTAGSNITIVNNVISSTSTSTFSGSYNDLTNKPTPLTAGSNIVIQNNVVSATIFSGNYNDLTNKLTAGSNIIITSNNLISATGFSTFSGNYNDLNDKPIALSAGSNILINNNVISATGFSTFSGSYNDLNDKPVPLTAGSNIVIQNNVVSATIFSGNYNDLTNKLTAGSNIVISSNNVISALSTINLNYNDLINKPILFQSSNHQHLIENITDLQTTLDGKQAILTAGPNISISNNIINTKINIIDRSYISGNAILDDPMVKHVYIKKQSLNNLGEFNEIEIRTIMNQNYKYKVSFKFISNNTKKDNYLQLFPNNENFDNIKTYFTWVPNTVGYLASSSKSFKTNHFLIDVRAGNEGRSPNGDIIIDPSINRISFTIQDDNGGVIGFGRKEGIPFIWNTIGKITNKSDDKERDKYSYMYVEVSIF